MSIVAPVPTPVVFDVNVFIAAVMSGGGRSAFTSWPVLPPTTANPDADCIGLVNDAREYSLWMSRHITRNLEIALGDALKWDADHIDDYLTELVVIAERSGGAWFEDVPRTVHDCPDFEDNMILDLAAHVDALVIVSNDMDLLHLNPWRSTLILEPRRFAARGDGARRTARRTRR